MKVKFNSIEEFIQEVEKDKEIVERKIVRTTVRRTTWKNVPGLYHYEIVATAKVGSNLVVLENYCGVEFPGEGNSKAGARLSNLKMDLKNMGFDVRAGTYEE